MKPHIVSFRIIRRLVAVCLIVLSVSYSMRLNAAVNDTFVVGDYVYTILSEEPYTVSIAADKAEEEWNNQIRGTIELPESIEYEGKQYTVTAIADSAFFARWEKIDSKSQSIAAKNMTRLILPSSIQHIGKKALYECRGLIEINLPEGLRTLGDGALSRAVKLKSIAIPSTLSVIGDSCFDHCTSLTKLIFEEEPTIQEIGISAFNTTGLVSVYLPASLKKLGDKAFYGCKSMTKLFMHEGLEYIGDRCFCNNTELEGDIIIPSTIKTICDFAFYDCRTVTRYVIKATTPPILKGTNAFLNRPESIIATPPIRIPCNTKEAYKQAPNWSDIILIEECEEAFYYQGLRYVVTNEQTHEVELIGSGSEIPNQLIIPNTVINPNDNVVYRVTSMGVACFKNNSLIHTITIPASMKIIPEEAFCSASNLTKLLFEDTIERIEAHAFYQCSSLTTIEFPHGLRYIGNRAFCHNGALTDITLPMTIECIEEFAFCNTFSVKQATINCTTPPTIGTRAFDSNVPTQPISYPIYIPCQTLDRYMANDEWKGMKERLIENDCLEVLTIYHNEQGDITTFEGGYIGEIEYKRIFSPGQWETIYLPFTIGDILLEDTYSINQPFVRGVQSGYFYLAELNRNGELIFSPDTKMQGNKPYLILFPTTDNYYVDKTITFSSEEVLNYIPFKNPSCNNGATMQLVGNHKMLPFSVPAPAYTYCQEQNVFILSESTFTLNPFECYILPQQVPNITMLPQRIATPSKPQEDTPTGCIPFINNDTSFICYSKDNTLHIIAEGQEITIHSIWGNLLQTYTDTNHITITLPSGCYIVSNGSYSQKVIL